MTHLYVWGKEWIWSCNNESMCSSDDNLFTGAPLRCRYFLKMVVLVDMLSVAGQDPNVTKSFNKPWLIHTDSQILEKARGSRAQTLNAHHAATVIARSWKVLFTHRFLNTLSSVWRSHRSLSPDLVVLLLLWLKARATHTWVVARGSLRFATYSV